MYSNPCIVVVSELKVPKDDRSYSNGDLPYPYATTVTVLHLPCERFDISLSLSETWRLRHKHDFLAY